MRGRWAGLAALAMAALPAAAQMAGPSCPGYFICPAVDFPEALRTNPDALAIAAAVAADERAAVRTSHTAIGGLQRNIALGDALAHDVTLSVKDNQSCGSCHVADTGNSGGVSLFNAKTAAVPGSLEFRAGFRKPLSLSYAYFAPILHYDPKARTFIGGNFWDMRATGLSTGYPTADQALIPFLSPFEMAMPDPACVVYRLSQNQNFSAFEDVWGKQSVAIDWPANVESLCARPSSTNDPSPILLRLSAAGRAQATVTYRNIAFSITQYELSPPVSAFTAKFDAVQQGAARFTAQEQAGHALFVGKANCAACHPARSTEPTIPALFTNYAALNVGTPKNDRVPYLTENVADSRGYVANPVGPNFIDNGLGAVLENSANPAWRSRAASFMGAFQVPTLRNIDKRPRPDFVKVYAHNGYFPDLRSIVHFYNTRDVLPTCPPALKRVGQTAHGQTVGVTCWPKPEQPLNVEHQLTGNLHLTAVEEHDLVAFLSALSDGYPSGF